MNEGQMRLMPNSYKWFVKQVKSSGIDDINDRRFR